MRPGRAADHSPPSSAAVMEEYPHSGPHRACNGITLSFYCPSPTFENYCILARFVNSFLIVNFLFFKIL